MLDQSFVIGGERRGEVAVDLQLTGVIEVTGDLDSHVAVSDFDLPESAELQPWFASQIEIEAE